MIKLTDIPLHDPFILTNTAEGKYFLYNSAKIESEDDVRSGVKVYTSEDLCLWSEPEIVFSVPDDCWANPAGGTWAPEVHEYRGQYYLFVTLHNREQEIKQPQPPGKEYGVNPYSSKVHLRGTVIAVSDSPRGPFKLLKKEGPHTPRKFMALDGTLFVDKSGWPWMVYCHEWIQIIDGTIEAVRLKKDLSDSQGSPVHLFKGSDAPWINREQKPTQQQKHYVTDGPQLYRTKEGILLMLWSSYNQQGYVQTVARSRSGTLKGPWEQLQPLVKNDSGHGMLFNDLHNNLKLILHHPFDMPQSRAYIYSVVDKGDKIELID
ncbi:MAG: glycoside hydrolase family 43 protein [Halanaerobiaceae bacterium]